MDPLAAANANVNAFGYLSIMVAVCLWFAWSRRTTLQAIASKYPAMAIFGLALGMRLINLGGESLWYDEAVTGLMTRLTLPDLVFATAADVHPPAFYILEWLIIRALGESDFALRLLPATASAGAAAMTYLIARDRLWPRAAAYAGIAAAIAPGLLYYGQEARQYSVLAFLLLVAIWAAEHKRWIAYAAALALALYVHNYAALYIAALLIVGVMTSTDVMLRLWATMAAALSYMPWLPTAWGQASAVSHGYWIQNLTPGRTIVEPVLTTMTGWRAPATLILIGAGAVFITTIAGIWQQSRSKSILALATVSILPPIMAVAVSAFLRPVYLPRAFILSAYLLCIVMAGYLYHDKTARIAMALLTVVLCVYHYSPALNKRDDIRAVASSLTTADRVLHTYEQTAVLFLWYAPQATHRLAYYPASLEWGLSADTRDALGIITTRDFEHFDYVVTASGAGASRAQIELTRRLTPAGPPLAVLYKQPLRWGSIYHVRTG